MTIKQYRRKQRQQLNAKVGQLMDEVDTMQRSLRVLQKSIRRGTQAELAKGAHDAQNSLVILTRDVMALQRIQQSIYLTSFLDGDAELLDEQRESGDTLPIHMILEKVDYVWDNVPQETLHTVDPFFQELKQLITGEQE